MRSSARSRRSRERTAAPPGPGGPSCGDVLLFLAFFFFYIYFYLFFFFLVLVCLCPPPPTRGKDFGSLRDGVVQGKEPSRPRTLPGPGCPVARWEGVRFGDAGDGDDFEVSRKQGGGRTRRSAALWGCSTERPSSPSTPRRLRLSLRSGRYRSSRLCEHLREAAS